MIRLDLDWSEQTFKQGITLQIQRTTSFRVDETNTHCRPIPIRLKFGMFFTLPFTSLVIFDGVAESNNATKVKLGSIRASNFNEMRQTIPHK